MIVAGMTQANPAYAQPFSPFGARGIFDGATTAFFAFIGADALANTAEEVQPHDYCIVSPRSGMQDSGCVSRPQTRLVTCSILVRSVHSYVYTQHTHCNLNV